MANTTRFYHELMARLIARIAIKACAWQMKWELNLKFNSGFMDKIYEVQNFKISSRGILKFEMREPQI